MTNEKLRARQKEIRFVMAIYKHRVFVPGVRPVPGRSKPEGSKAIDAC